VIGFKQKWVLKAESKQVGLSRRNGVKAQPEVVERSDRYVPKNRQNYCKAQTERQTKLGQSSSRARIEKVSGRYTAAKELATTVSHSLHRHCVLVSDAIKKDIEGMFET